MTITLGEHPTHVPEPFATLVRTHLANRPNLRTGAGTDSPWLLPGNLAGQPLHPNTAVNRLRDLGVDLLGARNRAIGELVLECPPSLVAKALGYSQTVAFLHSTAGLVPRCNKPEADRRWADPYGDARQPRRDACATGGSAGSTLGT